MATNYVVGSNVSGYLPDTDPIVVSTLKEAKQAARQEALFLAEETGNKPTVWAPISTITKRWLMRHDGPIAYAVIGNVVVWIAIES